MTINQFVQVNGLGITDAIVLRKKFFGMVDHYALYMGVRENRHVFIANYTQGVREIGEDELAEFLTQLEPTRIERFPGNEIQRVSAIRRAWSRVGQQAYDYITNNCEHFKNWVHWGEHRSEQVEAAGKVVAGAALIAGGALAIGLLASLLKED
ncbi:MAG: hypothetical protein GC178_06170 [Flavobacteriales bacterium]|nr:hypothetical protein [Flavobacteriales bacterium]